MQLACVPECHELQNARTHVNARSSPMGCAFPPLHTTTAPSPLRCVELSTKTVLRPQVAELVNISLTFDEDIQERPERASDGSDIGCLILDGYGPDDSKPNPFGQL